MNQADRYYGRRAEEYESRRAHSPVWERERVSLDEFLSTLQPGARILDVPVGTGRFLDLYKRLGHNAIGVDISEDMLNATGRRSKEIEFAVDLCQGSVFGLPFAEDSVDIAVCIRLLNWLTPRQVESAVAELARVSRHFVVVSARYRMIDRELNRSSRFRIATRSTLRYGWNAVQRSWGAQRLYIHKLSHLSQTFENATLEVVSRHTVDTVPGRSQFDILVLKTRYASRRFNSPQNA